MTSLLQLHSLYKIFSSSPPVTAVNNISLEILTGEKIAITGKSGSGKSTLLHMIGGIEQPTNGVVLLNGTSLYSLSDSERCSLRRKEIGFVFQFFNLIPELTVYENIVFPAYLDHCPVDQPYLQHVIDLLGLQDRMHHYPNQLSGGEQQRTAIARALINHPAILCADEPTGNLDENSSREVMDLFDLCHDEFGQTILLVTHESEIAQRMDRRIVLKDGSVLSDSIQNNLS